MKINYFDLAFFGHMKTVFGKKKKSILLLYRSVDGMLYRFTT
jgi:hypothetical protein